MSCKTSVKTYQDICNRNIIIGNDTNSHPFHYPRSIEISYVKQMCFYHNNFALLYWKITWNKFWIEFYKYDIINCSEMLIYSKRFN